MNKLYQNKSAYDPGRFRYKVIFQKQISVSDGSGGTTVDVENVLITKAVREAILKRPNFAGDIVTSGDKTELLGDWNFVIRARKDFFPTKSMIILCEDITYTIRTIIELDEPTQYIKVLAVKAQ